MIDTGSWIETYSGRMFHFHQPHESEIELIDIAHALSCICRFSGHCKVFYSVAEHSVRVCQMLQLHNYNVETQMAGLLHDAAEAYLGDVSRPLKQIIGAEYSVLESNIMGAIFKKYRIVDFDSAAVKWADEEMLKSEANSLMKSGGAGWQFRTQGFDPAILTRAWQQEIAEEAFKKEFARLAIAVVEARHERG